MNKLVKGSIAGAAGIALLLGGAGTFALWNDAAGVNGGTVQTGTLDIEANATPGVWTDVSTKTVAGVTSPSLQNGTTFNPTTQKLVPGDTVTYTKSVTLTAVGKNLKARLTYDPSSIIVAPSLTSLVTVTLAPGTLPVGTTATADGANAYIITPPASGSTTFDVVITVAFSDTTSAQVGQNLASAVNLTGASFTLTQVRP